MKGKMIWERGDGEVILSRRLQHGVPRVGLAFPPSVLQVNKVAAY